MIFSLSLASIYTNYTCVQVPDRESSFVYIFQNHNPFHLLMVLMVQIDYKNISYFSIGYNIIISKYLYIKLHFIYYNVL